MIKVLIYRKKTDEIISSLSNSTVGYDEMPASVMKQLMVYFVQLQTFLINKSISHVTFPDELKIAKVLPIYTNEDEQLIQDYSRKCLKSP